MKKILRLNQLTTKLSRRAMLGGAATAAVAIVQTAQGKSVQGSISVAELLPDDPTKRVGTLAGEVGTRSSFEKLVKKPSEISSRSPLQDFYGIITPSDLHFERHHAGVPVIDPAKHELLIHGLVDKPLVFTIADLKRFPSVSRIAFLECSGNFRTGKETMSPQDICGLTSQSEWTGVKLATLFREVGVKPSASWFLAEGGDAAVMTRSIPVKKGWDDAIIAYAQNGEALRPEQGYPVRLFLPGWEGNTNVKWLRRIELGDAPWHTREETSKYTENVKGGKIRQFSFDMDARSIITFPAYPKTVEKGWIEIRGIAWSGRGKVARVEVSTDAGKSWQLATLQDPILDKAHTGFRYLWHWNGADTEIMSRVTDETGYIQPTFTQLIEARGSDGGYHFNPITAWQIKSDGRVLNRPER
ncbi:MULTISPECIES: sulfite dehydrogenase [unclassified Spirosoma]|uniref:sulfite dehydrogenase n=1 Tax=unclassified Spirosoma TaxID=2621999 RepID=UPI00096397F9|nr:MULTISPECIES: sulfite dehydrogenase [unclassified Spirosoma]MBN8825970.1 sulfite dehydrogenase [Spirosoma sp.]OJW71001.1 MAG: sulfite dehydrogenase [Spirosoma sp. 48-14]